MSLRSSIRNVSTLAAIVAGASFASVSLAQTPPLPMPPPGMPPIPGLPPGLPGPAPTSPLPIPTTLPAPGSLPGIPSIPGLPSTLTLFSPSGTLLMPFMKDEAKKIYQKEKDALPAARKTIVDAIPLLSDPDRSQVNAFAGCDDSGKTFVVVTEGMYQILDLISNTRATDETFGTSYYDSYVKDLAAQQEGKAQVLPLPPGMLDPTKSLDQRKLKRQKQLFDESIAYIVGHELAHHYMGHLGSTCGGGGGGVLKTGDIVRAIQKVLPAINQGNELQADLEGTKNLLDAGQNEAEYKWSEGGALLVLDFFKKLQDLHPGAILFTFMSTHPAPDIRIPVVKNTANVWRLTHPGAITGNGTPSDSPKFPLPMPSGFPMPGAPSK